MSTRTFNLGGRAAAAIAVLLLLIAGIAIAGIGSGSMSLFAAEDAAPCSTDNTVPGTDTTELDSTDSTVPCLFGVGTTAPDDGSTTEGSTTTDPLDTVPTAATTEPGTESTSGTSTPATSRPDQGDDEKQADPLLLSMRDFRAAAQQWVRCLIDGGDCGPAPTAAEFGITDEAIDALDSRFQEQVQLRIERIERRVACVAGVEDPGRESLAECIGEDGERSATDRTRTDREDGTKSEESGEERGDRTEREQRRGERTDDRTGDGTRSGDQTQRDRAGTRP